MEINLKKLVAFLKAGKVEEICKLLRIPEPIAAEPRQFKILVENYIDLGYKTPIHDLVLDRVFFFDIRGRIAFNVRKSVFDEARGIFDLRYGYTSGYFSNQTFEIDWQRFMGNLSGPSSLSWNTHNVDGAINSRNFE